MAQQVTTGQQQQYGTTGQQGSMGQYGQAMTDAGQLPTQHRQALDSVAQAVQVCGWCADKCIQSADPNMVECIRLCEDVVEIGETILATAPRESRFTADLARVFAQAADACARECGRHSQSHCQECASVLPQAAQAVQGLGATGHGQGTQQLGGQQGGFSASQ